MYVAGLAAWQRSFGCDAAVAAPSTAKTSYDHAGIPVWRFPISPKLDLRDLYGDGDRIAAQAFGEILDDFTPDIVHLHAMTSGVSVRLAEQAAERGIPIVFNYHTPTVSCPRGTLLKWGSEICDGKLDKCACASCTLHANGLPRPIATLIGSIPPAVRSGFARPRLAGGVWTALRTPDLIDLRIRAFHRLMQIADRVIALCDWTRALLIRNAVPENKITLCRQGIIWSSGDIGVQHRQPWLPLRAAFLGRLDSTKGAHVIVEALIRDRKLPVELDLFGIRQSEPGNRYAATIEAMVAGDARIRMMAPLSPGEVVPRLREYDVLLVPSQWLETGPLVVLEAFAARTPVIGSNLGGIAELVRHGLDGVLVYPYHSPSAWTNSLRRLCLDGDLLANLRAGIRPPRHVREVALETAPLYADLIGSRELNTTSGAAAHQRPQPVTI